MRKTELYQKRENVILVKTYSDINMHIQKIGESTLYDGAVDLGYYDESLQQYVPYNVEYIETNIPIKKDFSVEVPDNENRTR